MYKKYLDYKLIEEVLGKVHASKTILFKENFKNKEEGYRQYNFFNENMFDYMLSIAMLIFQKHEVIDLAYEVLEVHTSKKNIETVKGNMHYFNYRIKSLKHENKKMILLDNPLILNYIFCTVYLEQNNVSMFELEPLTILLEKAQEHVENIITSSILNRVKIEKNI